MDGVLMLVVGIGAMFIVIGLAQIGPRPGKNVCQWCKEDYCEWPNDPLAHGDYH